MRKEHRTQPGAREAESPAWIVLNKHLFPLGSVFHENFPDILEGRRRPLTTFSGSIHTLPNRRTKLTQTLEQRGIVTITDLLATPQEEIRAIRGGTRMLERVRHFMEDCAILPHARLLMAIFGEPKPEKFLGITPSDEGRIIRAVNTILPTLTWREMSVLKLRFGLDDGRAKTLEEVSKIYYVTRERIRQIECRAMRKLRYPTRSRHLRYLLPLPERSFGHILFGFTLEEHRLPFQENIRILSLSPATLVELTNADAFSFKTKSVGNLLACDIDLAPLSFRARGEITKKLRQYMVTFTKNTKKQSPQHEEPKQHRNHDPVDPKEKK